MRADPIRAGWSQSLNRGRGCGERGLACDRIIARNRPALRCKRGQHVSLCEHGGGLDLRVNDKSGTKTKVITREARDACGEECSSGVEPDEHVSGVVGRRLGSDRGGQKIEDAGAGR